MLANKAAKKTVENLIIRKNSIFVLVTVTFSHGKNFTTGQILITCEVTFSQL